VLLLVGTTLGIGSDILSCPNYAVMDYVWLRGIFIAGVNNDTVSTVINTRIYWPTDSVNLSFDTRVVSCEPCKRIHVNADLPIHEIYVFADYIVERFTQSALSSIIIDNQ